jgi:D-alanyl-D-alanine carboxypeptidase
LLERGFNGNSLSWLRPTLGTVDNLVPIDASPPNLRDEMCGGHRKRPASDEDEDSSRASGGESGTTLFTASMQPPAIKPLELLASAPAASEPVVVYTGPTRTGAALIAAVAADTDEQSKGKRKGRKARVAAAKPDAAAPQTADVKPADVKPAPVRHANARPDTGPKAGDKAGDTPLAAAKPAKPKKDAAKTAPKNATGDAAPAEQKTSAPHT